jgi:hypothetical protein
LPARLSLRAGTQNQQNDRAGEIRDAVPLRAFAKRLRLRMEWIQKPGTDMVHFDLSPAVRDNAIAAGAVPVSGVEQFRRCVLPKRAPENRAILEEGLKDG